MSLSLMFRHSELAVTGPGRSLDPLSNGPTGALVPLPTGPSAHWAAAIVWMARIARMGTYAESMCVLGSTSCQKKNKGRISMKMAVHDSHLVKTTIAAALLVAMAQPGFGERLNYKPVTVKTPDGLTISAQEWGNPAGPEIL